MDAQLRVLLYGDYRDGSPGIDFGKCSSTFFFVLLIDIKLRAKVYGINI